VPSLTFEKELGSRSQPLLLQVARRPDFWELLPPLPLALVAAATGIGVLLGGFVLRERRAAREARERASFHEHQARLAHAMRVNTVGEMASGIAHELTQPLTAILSRSQAGLRLARSPAPNPGEIIIALDANVRLAKRAGDILARLRAYVSNSAPAPEPASLNQLVRNVAELVQGDLERRGIGLELGLDLEDPVCVVDRVSIEQVVHNLVRNAADAVETLPQDQRTVAVATGLEDGAATIVVRDQGPGIAPADLPRLFEPFFTTKPNGMGLGLPLCERLVEAFGGRITAANVPEGGAVFTVRLPLLAEGRKEAAE
jgi:C4-dicarboxylate-specific signal transduction histidine kinase